MTLYSASGLKKTYSGKTILDIDSMEIEQGNIYNQIDFKIPPVDPANTSANSILNEEIVRTPLPFVRCPSDPAPPTEA